MGRWPTRTGRNACVVQPGSLMVFDADGKRLRGVKIEDQSGRILPQRNRSC